MGEWIDFRQLREQLDFAAVLQHYGVALKSTAGGQHKSRCPLPRHPKDNTSLAFSANLKKKIFRCFGCGTSGNALDFGVLMEGGNPKNSMDVRKTALKLQSMFGSARRATPPSRASVPLPSKVTPPAPTMVVNPPLDFALKNLSTDHAFFHKRRLLPATIEHFGLGYCTKGMFAGRIVIPLWSDDKLIGYAGRLTDEFEVTNEQSLYLWPTERERNAVKHIFDRTRFLYHGHAIDAPATDLVVVQGVESAWSVWQAGFQDVVALMGDSPSAAQSKTILELTQPSSRVWLLTDGNKRGDQCAGDLFYDVGQSRFCTWLKLSEGQPTDCTADELRAMLTWTINT